MMVISMHFNSIDITKLMLGDFILVWGLRVHTYTKHVDVLSDFDQNEANFLIRYHKYMLQQCQTLHD